ncbi:hypothetical protein [Pedobacter flavus]|uniref:Uncharacterized protein n=1 Tax=Pedobacter flavus TaxID=3113906 RepID=A0ABU7H056_9SPHI|nr:hypothetical protein [Pedobacter sp. VNH31]MEE1884560.1 hypothetical protein [Pedobacter sp. VNH31]
MKSNQEIYKAHLEAAPLILRETVEQLELIILNLSMSGEYGDLNDLFDENETVVFGDDFRNVTDYNVRLLYSITDFINSKNAELMNVNSMGGQDDLPF